MTANSDANPTGILNSNPTGTSSSISKSGWVPVATLLRPQGRRGELLAEPLSDLPNIFSPSRELFLTAPNVATPAPNASPIQIEEYWFPTGKNAGRVVLKLSGCETISDAEALAGKQVLVPTDQLPTLDPGTFFVGDLVGCTVFNSGQAIGTIVGVEFATAPDGRTRLEDAAPLLAIQLLHATPSPESPNQQDGPEPILIPFVRSWLDEVDISNRRITMNLPEGLLDAPEIP